MFTKIDFNKKSVASIVAFLDFFLKRTSTVPTYKKQLRNVLGFTPGAVNLYKTALTHRSVRDAAADNNERLECDKSAFWAGDAFERRI